MSDRVPIGTHPGSIATLVDQDLIVAPAASVAYDVSQVFIRRTDDSTDAVVAAIRNATGGGGDALAVTIADGAWSGVSTGAAITVDVGESLYLRVTSANALSMNLSGWFDMSDAPGITALLTSLVRIKRYLSIDGTDDDSLFNELMVSVSRELVKHLGYEFVQTTATAEKPDAPLGDHILQLNHRPIVSIGSITEAGGALVEDTDFECLEADKACGQVIRLSGGYPHVWNSSPRRISVTYDHGYATVPDEILQAATELVVFDYLQTVPGGKRIALRGSAHDPGGTGEYMSREEVWKAQLTRLSAHRRM